MNVAWKRRGKVALALLGLALLASAIYRTGPLLILTVARGALPFVPVIMVFNFGFYAFEGLGHRQMLGASASQVPKGAIARATLSAFVTALVFPLGRAGAELVRTSILAPYVGAPRASAASASFQIPAMFGISVLGVAVFSVAVGRLGLSHPLTLAVSFHTLFSVGFATFLLILSRNVGLGSALLKRFPKLRESAKTFDQALRSRPLDYVISTGYCVLARVSEFIQYAIVLAVLSVPWSLSTTLIANGIHVVGATAGEFIPGQLGTIEGAYLYFAGALDLAETPARAVSLALLVRVAQYTEAALSFLVLQLWPRPEEVAVPE